MVKALRTSTATPHSPLQVSVGLQGFDGLQNCPFRMESLLAHTLARLGCAPGYCGKDSLHAESGKNDSSKLIMTAILHIVVS